MTIPNVVIEPNKRLFRIGLRDIWKYRELFYFLTWRDVKVRYKQTFIGGLWAILAFNDNGDLHSYLWPFCQNPIGWPTLSDFCLGGYSSPGHILLKR